ncbi:hypothetical protein HID58_062063 [Brassica napus]|uniref:Uncharacterized protein n=1 Tax=Brassica napus TaxID=3708 RepID=A0ABQ8A0Y2_BRANA|nr:hypothetical protein HID58_062063 [Brassica napus]
MVMGIDQPIVESTYTMTIILNGRVECMKSHQQRTTLQSAGYQYSETKLEDLVVLAEREFQATILAERELQVAVLTEREFQKAVLAAHKETYEAAGREEDETATEKAEDGTTTEKTKSPTEP